MMTIHNADYSITNFVPEPECLTAIVLTKNEEKNIGRCLASLSFVDEIVIIDSGSTDNTLNIVKTFPKVTLVETKWFGFVETKKIGVAKAKHDWILWIDADEEVPAKLAEEWQTRIKTSSFHETGAIDISRKTFFLGHFVKHSGWYPNRVIRFFHKGRAGFNNNILHEGIVVKPGYLTEHFTTDLLHYSYISLYQYFDKMNKYGYDGAREVVRKKKSILLPQLFFQPVWTFFKFYILKRGFLDGRIGFIVCMGAAFSNFIKYSNYFFMKKYDPSSLDPSNKIIKPSDAL